MCFAERTVDIVGAHMVASGSYVVVTASARGCILKDFFVALGCIYRDTYWRIIVVISRRKLSSSRTVTSQRARTLGFCVVLYGISKFCDKF